MIRGGTSRGLFLLEDSIRNVTGKNRDDLMFHIMGNGTIKGCIDGLGGEASSVNKIAVLDRLSHSQIHYNIGTINRKCNRLGRHLW